MRDIFFSEPAWRVIPIVTSIACLVGSAYAVAILGIAKRNHLRHSNDHLINYATYLHRNALQRLLALLLLVTAGMLFTLGWLPAPPPTGRYLAVWANHYIVGVIGVILSLNARRDFQARVTLE